MGDAKVEGGYQKGRRLIVLKRGLTGMALPITYYILVGGKRAKEKKRKGVAYKNVGGRKEYHYFPRLVSRVST